MPHAGSLWSRLRLSGRRAARWRFQLAVTGCTFELRGRTLKRPPHRLCLLLTRKKRKVSSAQFKWHCTQPTRPSAVALVVGNEQEPLDFQSTLNTKTTVDDGGFEDKRWALVLEEVTKTGQRKPLAQAKLNLADIVGDTTEEKIFKEIQQIELKGFKDRVGNVRLNLHLAGVLLKTGQATDEDMQSLASMFSTQTLDIGNLDDFSDSLSHDSSSNMGAETMDALKFLTNDLQALTDQLELPSGTLRSRSSRGGSTASRGDNISLRSFGDDFSSDNRLTKTLPRNFEQRLSVTEPVKEPVTPPSERKLKPSPLTFDRPKPDVSGDEEVEEVVGGVAQELLSWVREATADSNLVNITNLTSSFRSGIAFALLLKHYRPALIDPATLNPRTAKANLKLVLEAYNKAGLDLYGIINVNETASKPDKLAVITALHKIRTKFDGGVKLRQKKESTTTAQPKRESVHSVLFDQKTTWTSFAEFTIETLHEELRRLEEVPDKYSVAVDDILDNLDFDSDEENQEDKENDQADMIRAQIEVLEAKNNESVKLRKKPTETIDHLHGIHQPAAKNTNVTDITPDQLKFKPDPDFRNSLKESIEIDEFLELEALACGEENESNLENVTLLPPRLPSPPDLLSSDDEDDLLIRDEHMIKSDYRRKRLSTVDEGNEIFLESESDDELDSLSDCYFKQLQNQRRNILMSIDEEDNLEQEREEKRKIEAEKARLEEEQKLKLAEENRLKELQEAEEARKRDEELRRAREELERQRKAEEEEAKIAELRLKEILEAKQAEEAQQAEIKRLEEEKLRIEAEKRREQEAKLTLEKRRKAEEEARIAEEKRLQEEARLREQKRLLEEQRIAAEEARQAEIKRLEEEKLRIEAEERRKEEARLAREAQLLEEKRLKELQEAEEARRKEEKLRLAREELEKRQREEKLRKEEEARLAEEARIKAELEKLEEERKADEERKAKLAEEAKRLEEEAKRAELEKLARLEEERKKEEDRKLREEKIRRERELAEEKAKEQKRVEELRLREIAAEEAKKAEELRLKEEARKRLEAEEKARIEEEKRVLEEERKQAELAEQKRREAEAAKRPKSLVLNSGSSKGILDTDSSSDDERALVNAAAIAEDQRKFDENNQLWFMRLQELNEQSIRIEEEQEEVDERAQQVEPDYRRAVESKNAKLESDLTAEWLALIQKRDGLVHQAERIFKERVAVKLEIELNTINFEARKIALIDENRKTQIDRDKEKQLVEKVMELVTAKHQIDQEIDDIDGEILRQREAHAKQMEQNLIEQKTKAEETSSTLSFGRWKIW